MCFSATASFGAAAVLGTIGVASIKKARTNPQKTFALIPLLFGAQQFTEGLLWVSLSNDPTAAHIPLLTNMFLVFAWLIWPSFIPFSLRLMELNNTRKKILNALTGIGIVVFILLSYYIWITPITAKVGSFHIIYDHGPPHELLWIISAMYLFSTTIACFVSSVPKVKILGGVNLVSFIYSKYFFEESVISVWCFFAAISSILVLYIIHSEQRAYKPYIPSSTLTTN